MTTFDALVTGIVRETADTATIFLDAPRDYQAGQFLNIDPMQVAATKPLAEELERRKGKKERPRAYSLASAPHEERVAITVKAESGGEFPPVMTPFLLNQLREGDRLPAAGYAGLYTLPDDLPEGAHVVHVCAGSGIVPNWGIIKDALHRKLPVRQTLLDSNRCWADVIYREQLTRLEVAHPQRLKIVHYLTRDRAGAPSSSVPSRLDAAAIRAQVPDRSNAWFFVCGPSVPTHERVAARRAGVTPPPRFLESMRAVLTEMGVAKQRLHIEGW